MHQRKVQLIAGTTYTVSLPKAWVKQNRISNKSSVFINEREDGSLQVLPALTGKPAEQDSITVNIENQEDNISHILFAAYYMGIENIRLFSRKEISSRTRNKVKSTLTNLSGVEIVFEDLNRMDLKVLLDISKTNIDQLLFRTNIIIKSCIDIILNNGNVDDLLRNEDEVDRLHHLITKMILLSSKDAAMLKNSGIMNISHTLSYSAISKKLEHIADALAELGEYVLQKKSVPPKSLSTLKFLGSRLSRDVSLLVKKNLPKEHEKDMTEIGKIEKEIAQIKDANISIHLSSIASSIVDIEEELLNMVYYKKMLESGE